MQQQMAQMQSMMDSMSPEMRQELEDAMGSALDPETLQAMNELASMMEVMMPMDELRRSIPSWAMTAWTMDQAMDLMRQLQENDLLEQALRKQCAPATWRISTPTSWPNCWAMTPNGYGSNWTNCARC